MIRLTASVPSVGSTGTVIVEGLFLPGAQRPRQAIELGHVNCPGPAVERFQPLPGGYEVLGGVDLAEKCSLATQAQATSSQVVTIGMRQSGVDAAADGAAQAFFADEQQPADVVERMSLATSMSHHVLLGALADFRDDLIR